MKPAPVIAVFCNQGGVGKTSLVYHLSWMYADLGARVLAADLDPQANLTAAFLAEELLESLWPEGEHPNTISGCMKPLREGTGDVREPHLEAIDEGLALIPGDPDLSDFEDSLSEAWLRCLVNDERAFHITSAFWRVIQEAASSHRADLIMIDLGSNLGAISRAALIASDSIVVPLSPDPFSLQGLRNLGPKLRGWRSDWQTRLPRKVAREPQLPLGSMHPIGYVLRHHSADLSRPARSYEKWMQQIPGNFRRTVLNEKDEGPMSPRLDVNCLAILKDYRSLMFLAQQARKPIFHMKPADGALGSHLQVAQEARQEFTRLALRIATKSNFVWPGMPQEQLAL
jgi:chromosome partitioning protein